MTSDTGPGPLLTTDFVSC